MKIQLIFSPIRKHNRFAQVPGTINPPLGILYIAGYLRKHLPDLTLKVTDGLLAGWNKTLEEIDKFSPDIIFISYLSPCALSAYDLVNIIKQKDSKVITVLGGPHVSALPAEPFELSRTDFSVVGEGEQTSLELVRAISKKRGNYHHIGGLYWRDNGKITPNKPRAFIENLDDIPFPARDMIDLKEYTGWFACKETPDTTIITSRGCPFNCTFCSNAVWKSSTPWRRVRSPLNIVNEMEHLKRDYGIQEVFDTADEFNSRPSHALAVCEEMIRRRLDMPWKTQLRATPLSEELVRRMKEAGCWYVQLGIESGNERTLRGIKKNVTLEQAENTCKLLKKYNIKVFGLFMLFNVWEEDGKLAYEGIRQTENTLTYAKYLIDRKLIDYISGAVTTPYPGSQLFNICQRFGLIKGNLTREWDRWFIENQFIMDLPGVSTKDVSRMNFKAVRLKAHCVLKTGNWGLKDLPLFFKKSFGALATRLHT